MKKQQYIAPETAVIRVAVQQIICASFSISSGSLDDDEQPEKDESGCYIAE